MRALLERAEERLDETVSLLRELVEIESPTSSAAGVAAVASRLARELRALGLETELLPVEGAGPILRARTPPTSQSPVMLLGHMDTVWPEGTLARRPALVDGDILRGPGCYDMKAGLAIVVEALRLLAAEPPLPPSLVFFTPLEEEDCEPYRQLMEDEMRRCAAVLDFEPAGPGGALKTGRKGSGTFVIRARGVAAHAGAEPERGANAICEIARQVLEASALTRLGPGIGVNAGVIRGGIRPNVVPDEAEVELDVRFATAAEAERLEGGLRALRPADPRVRLEIGGGIHYPPLERNAAVRGLYAQASDVAQELGFAVAEHSTGGASEASFAAALGLPTLDGLGAEGDGAHADHEHVVVSSLPRRVALCVGLMRRFGES